MMSRLRKWAKALKQQTLIVYFAARDSRTPWYARILALCIAAYALSPIDLIPDFIPILGYVDDLILVPLGLMLVLRLIPPQVMAAAHAQAADVIDRPTSRVMAAIIAALWLIALGVTGLWVWRTLHT